MSSIEYYGEAKEVMRKAQWLFTKEEIIRNFFGLSRTEQVDGNGRVVDIRDEMRIDSVLKAKWVYDYYKYQKRLLELGVTEQDMRNYFPNVRFIEAGSTTTPESGAESTVSDIQEATEKPKRGRRKSSLE